jgi:hypothetical protein
MKNVDCIHSFNTGLVPTADRAPSRQGYLHVQSVVCLQSRKVCRFFGKFSFPCAAKRPKEILTLDHKSFTLRDREPPSAPGSSEKPRLPGAEPNGEPASKEEIALSREYLAARNRQMASKAAVADMELAQRRGELISRQLAFSQLGYLLVAFRQRTLLAPAAITRRLVSLNLVDPEKRLAIQEAIAEDIHMLLTELSDLPMKVTDPNWLERLEAEENQTVGERLQTPGELKAEQAKVEHRRKQKTETMRRLRAKH